MVAVVRGPEEVEGGQVPAPQLRAHEGLGDLAEVGTPGDEDGEHLTYIYIYIYICIHV